ncbi:50S ribosomal protein L21 [Sphingomonas sp. HDW15A]|uniref:50S ribosomal protein L21 n=1 Tax=Sphingomonas sp. HDW15A TaxID=2714942 RepID=UPI00140956A8|nr:50S ribosomal protein L21 [Sphingomonas sp. HDW15A]QIK95311.1 50S ribosomal protein L21 [Sphingomonas sp. HDW15A]
MFAIVRTGGKQYRVAPGDKIVVEKLAGEAGDNIDLTDVLLAGDGGDLKSTGGLTVAAKIVAQAKGEKVTVFKKRRRHNYRRKKGHRQQHTILEIVSIGGKSAAKKAEAKPAAEKKAEAAPAKVEKAAKPAAKKEAAPKASTKDAAPAKAADKKAAPKATPKKK